MSEQESTEKVYKTHQVIINHKMDLYSYLEKSIRNSNNLYNATNFHIRQLYTGLTKEGELHDLQKEVINNL